MVQPGDHRTMLAFVGLGLYDERSITLEGRTAIHAADRVFAEFYTGVLAGAGLDDLEDALDTEIEVRDRDGVERDPGAILDAAAGGDAAFLTAGDPMISTTHVDLRLRAHERGIGTRVVHGTSAATAAAGLCGLQNYRFGKSTTLPFPGVHGGVPGSVIETIEANRASGLHTLVYLDIEVDTVPRDGDLVDAGRFLTADRAAAALAPEIGEESIGVVIARAGSPDPVVAADRLAALRDGSFGPPLHLLVLPGDLHDLEVAALEAFGGAPTEAVEAAGSG